MKYTTYYLIKRRFSIPSVFSLFFLFHFSILRSECSSLQTERLTNAPLTPFRSKLSTIISMLQAETVKQREGSNLPKVIQDSIVILESALSPGLLLGFLSVLQDAQRNPLARRHCLSADCPRRADTGARSSCPFPLQINTCRPFARSPSGP